MAERTPPRLGGPSGDAIFRAVASLALAFLLWAWVTTQRDPPDTRVFPNLTLQEPALQEPYQIAGELPQVTIQVTGPRSVLDNVSRAGLRPSLDVSGVTGPGNYQATVEVDLPAIRVRIDGAWVSGSAAVHGRDLWLETGGRTFLLSEPDDLVRNRRAEDPSRITAPVTGLVRSVAVAPGAVVQEGQTLLVIEAMKMETSLAARISGTVSAVHVAVGEQAGIGQLLVEMTPAT